MTMEYIRNLRLSLVLHMAIRKSWFMHVLIGSFQPIGLSVTTECRSGAHLVVVLADSRYVDDFYATTNT